MFESQADRHINDLIKSLCERADSLAFRGDLDRSQEIVDQIAQLRASQNPIVQMTDR